jgi:DNA segregation ATPase FtsK/SpoIIIE-like protein
MNKLLGLLLIVAGCFVVAVPAVLPQGTAGQNEEPVLVGRIAHIDGKLLRYVSEEKDWVATVEDAPFGLDDALYSDQDGKAEFVMPNDTWVRIGGSTQIQLIALKNDVTEIDVASGTARFYNKSSAGVIQATTPFGYVVAEGGAVFDLYVGDDSMEAIALKGVVHFVHEADKKKYDVQTNTASLVADTRQVTSGEGQVDADWDDWNASRDTVWQKRVAVRGESVRHLPPPLQNDAYALEENGRWENVEYEGTRRQLWRPVRVDTGWSPFTAGRWTEYYGDQCWIPQEPFGYVTHHYGNWVTVRGAWYWAPPVVVRPVVHAPAVNISFGWYPGRVAWIHSGVNVGWVPLAPAEPYYAVRRWGPQVTVVSNVASVHININSFRFVDHAIVVPQARFYSVNNYRPVRVANINRTTIINNYRPAPVVNNTVINNYNTINQRYVYNTDARVDRKPHQEVVNRIERNRDISQRTAPGVNANEITRNIRQVDSGTVADRPARAPRPTVTTKLVNPDEVSKPKDQVHFQQRQVKERERPAQESPAIKLPAPEPRRGTTEQQEGPQGIRPGRPVAPGREQPAERPGVVRPSRPSQEPPQGEEGGRARPERPRRPVPPRETGQAESPPPETPRTRPGRAGQEAQPETPTPPEKSRQQTQEPRRPETEQQRQQQGELQRRQQQEQQQRQQAEQQRRQQQQEQQQRQQAEQQRRQQQQEQQQRQQQQQQQPQQQIDQQRQQQADQQRRQQQMEQQQRQQQAEQQRQQQADQQRRQQAQQQQRQQQASCPEGCTCPGAASVPGRPTCSPSCCQQRGHR